MSTAGRLIARAAFLGAVGDIASAEACTLERPVDADSELYLHKVLPLSTARTTIDLTPFANIKGLLVTNLSENENEDIFVSTYAPLGSREPSSPLGIKVESLGDSLGKITDLAALGLYKLGLNTGVAFNIVGSIGGLNDRVGYVVSTTAGAGSIGTAFNFVFEDGAAPDVQANDPGARIDFYSSATRQLPPGGSLAVAQEGINSLRLVAASGTPKAEIFIFGD